MEILHKKMIGIYYSIIDEHFKKEQFQPNIILNPTLSIIDKTTEALRELMDDEAQISVNNEVSEYIDDDTNPNELEADIAYLLKKEKILYEIDVIKVALIQAIAFPTQKGNQLIEYVNQTSITEVINKFNTDIDFEREVILFYIRYLVSKAEALISSYTESVIIRNNKLIWSIDFHKGLNTIVDLAKQAFIELYEDLKDTYGYNDKIWEIIDRFLSDAPVCLNYFEQNGISTSDKPYLNMIKKKLIRAIISDAYIDLKCTENEAACTEGEIIPPEDILAIEYIEQMDNDDNYILPSDKLMRQSIYSHALLYNAEIIPYREMDFDSLQDEIKEHVITINPFSQI